MLVAPGRVVLGLLQCEAADVPRSVLCVLAALAGVLATAVAAPVVEAQVGTVTEIPLVSGSDPYEITAGPDGNLWFTNLNAGYIGRVTPAGTLTRFSAGVSPGELRGIVAGPDGNLWFPNDNGTIGRITPTGTVTNLPAGNDPYEIALGPDGNLWFTEFDYTRIGRITPTGTVTFFFSGISGGSVKLYDIVAGPDGNLWFTELRGDRIGRITPTGTITEFPITPGSRPYGIARGPDGNLWFAQRGADRIGRITPAGVVTNFSAGITAGSVPLDIAAGPDGNLWFTELDGNRIGRITPSGIVTEFPVTTANSEPYGIAAGPDGQMWFTERAAARIGRISVTTTPAPAPVPPPPTPAIDPPAGGAPPAPGVDAPARASYAALIGGLRRVTSVEVGAASVAFTQRVAAAGRLRWTLDVSFYRVGTRRARTGPAVEVPKPRHLATGSRTITRAGAVRGRLKLGPAARALLERHSAARLVLRTTLTLADHRVIRATRTLRRSR
jgi:streptogramin lyase